MLAYLDANSGSLIASAIAAGFAGIAVVFKLGWAKTIGMLSPKRRRARKEEAEQEALAAAAAAEQEPAVRAHDASEA